MRSIEIILAEIKDTEAALLPLNERLRCLNRERDSVKSKTFIEVNGITKDDVEPSHGPGKPWFGIVTQFGDWLKTDCSKPWAEWNGTIYHTTDLINNRMPDMPGRTSDIPGIDV